MERPLFEPSEPLREQSRDKLLPSLSFVLELIGIPFLPGGLLFGSVFALAAGWTALARIRRG